jgi:hypothetical protein
MSERRCKSLMAIDWVLIAFAFIQSKKVSDLVKHRNPGPAGQVRVQ